MHTFFGGCCRGWYFQNERAPAVPVKGAGGQWLGLWEAARASPAATHYYTDPLKSPTSFHTSSQKSNQLTHFLLIVQPASILPLKVQPHLPYFLSKVHQPSILPFKSPTTFHTSSQMSNQPPYFLSKVKPPSILPLKVQTHLPYFLSKVHQPSILPFKSSTTFHTSSQKINQPFLARRLLFFLQKWP